MTCVGCGQSHEPCRDPAFALPDEMRSRIIERTGGNPLFIEEINRGLIEDGVLVRDGTGWHLTANDRPVEIPPGIQALLLRASIACRERRAASRRRPP